MSDLYVAAGGGGDPIGALIAARTVTVDPAPPLIATYAWERPEVDPTARPLGRRDFTGLTREAGATAFASATRARPPAGSTMPGLARDLPARLLLLDPARGLTSLSRQIVTMAEAAGGRIRVIDVGGDVLTHGDEPTLRSPFGDALTLAACRLAGVPTTVYVAGPGLDGEIDERLLLERLTGRHPLTPGPDAASAAGPALAWHPSEASALWAAAVHGARGTVRTVHRTVRLTSVSPRLYHLPLREAVDHNPVARALLDERPATLEAAADLSHRLTGIPGLAPERDRAPGDHALAGSAALLDRERAMKTLREAADGADHVTLRYAARALDLPWTAIPSVREALGGDTPLLRLT
ncbi:DUF1152 domain-containing protein [Streptomyces sp. NPDC057367]|uniref:DUF1152 domain-containing protein n=1 Tax=Streptomyces sp. NPDC057367 TaxID=3346108 RepID=UPI00363C3CB4